MLGKELCQRTYTSEFNAHSTILNLTLVTTKLPINIFITFLNFDFPSNFFEFMLKDFIVTKMVQ